MYLMVTKRTMRVEIDMILMKIVMMKTAEPDEIIVKTPKQTKRKRVSEPSTTMADPLPTDFRHIRNNVISTYRV